MVEKPRGPRHRPPEPVAVNCPVCGSHLDQPARGRPRRYCSPECRRKAEYALRRHVASEKRRQQAQRSKPFGWSRRVKRIPDEADMSLHAIKMLAHQMHELNYPGTQLHYHAAWLRATDQERLRLLSDLPRVIETTRAILAAQPDYSPVEKSNGRVHSGGG